jgi:hypothetical protein
LAVGGFDPGRNEAERWFTLLPRTDTTAHSLGIDGSLVTELYDVVTLTGTRQPMALGFKTNEIERLLLVDEPGTLQRSFPSRRRNGGASCVNVADTKPDCHFGRLQIRRVFESGQNSSPYYCPAYGIMAASWAK